jgi:protein-S-isoprenylcysteine O-methyltransferase Ste14
MLQREKMKNRMNPPTYFLLLLAVQILLNFVYPTRRIIEYPFSLIGIALISFGTCINLWTDNLFKISKTTVKPYKKPAKLIESGPFKLSRHPMYLGMASILFGVSVICGTLVTLFVPIVFIVLVEILFIPIEESNLKKAFGKEFEQYKSRVRRWI